MIHFRVCEIVLLIRHCAVRRAGLSAERAINFPLDPSCSAIGGQTGERRREKLCVNVNRIYGQLQGLEMNATTLTKL